MIASQLLIIFLGSTVAGVIGALAGLGGGVVIVPMLAAGMGIDIHYAIGASIVSVIATSSGSAAVYIRDRMANLQVGTFLCLATTIGAICGALIARMVPHNVLFVAFGVVLGVSTIPLMAHLGEELPSGVKEDRWSTCLRLGSSYRDEALGKTVSYCATRVPLGFALMWVAGVLSGLLGIGSGVFKVLAMDLGMRLPMKVSTTTSNFMIGITAAASAGIYWRRGDVDPLIAGPVALGILLGAGLGGRLIERMRNSTLRKLFVPLLLIIAVEMLLRGLGMNT